MYAELARWEAAKDTILDMTLKEQASYADYVTKKICADQDIQLVIIITANMHATAPIGEITKTCAIGNSALLTQTILSRSNDEQLKTRMFTLHQRSVAEQKKLRAAESGCKIQ